MVLCIKKFGYESILYVKVKVLSPILKYHHTRLNFYLKLKGRKTKVEHLNVVFSLKRLRHYLNF